MVIYTLIFLFFEFQNVLIEKKKNNLFFINSQLWLAEATFSIKIATLIYIEEEGLLNKN
jgi:hypothetical protein